VTILFEGVDREVVNFGGILDMATELFTHLGIAFMNPGGPKSGVGTPHSVSQFVSIDTDKLLEVAAQEGFGKRKQDALKALCFKRDGNRCVLTDAPFKPTTPTGMEPILSHVVPNSVHSKPDTLKCIAMLAGTGVRDLVIKNLNSIGNVVNLEMNAHATYDDIEWTIQANKDHDKVTYTFKMLSGDDSPAPGYIQLKHGEEIRFASGKAEDINKLGGGPLPALCNLQYAVARVLHMSGAADIITKWKDDADCSDLPHICIASTDFANILTAKLLLNSGQPL